MYRRDEMLAYRSPLFSGAASRLHGEWDAEARAAWEAATAFMSSEAFPEITEANVPRLRDMTKPQRSQADLAAMAECETTVAACDGTRFGSPDNARIEIRVHLPGGTGRPRKGLVFYHGGAFVLGSAADEDPWACRTAAECGLVVFNVDYRNAPETRAPGGILDCYAALRCVVAELCGRYGVDRRRVGVYGISSGGYLAAGVAMELAKRREAGLARLIIADAPAVSDHWVRRYPDPEAGPWHWSDGEVERWHGTHGHIETLAMLAEDWERQVRDRDPYLFPGAMGDDLLEHVPDHVVMTREFDFLRTDAELFASDLARHGKLLDFYVRPGASHYSGPEDGVLKRIVDAYL